MIQLPNTQMGAPHRSPQKQKARIAATAQQQNIEENPQAFTSLAENPTQPIHPELTSMILDLNIQLANQNQTINQKQTDNQTTLNQLSMSKQMSKCS